MANRIIIAVGLIIAAVYIYSAHQIPTTAGDPIGPRTFPYLISFGLVASLAWLILEHIREGRLASDQRREPVTEESRPLMLALVVVGTGVYYLILEPIGFIAATSLYLFALSTALDRRRMFVNALVSGGFAILLFLLFSRVLQSNLPMGLIFS